MTLCILNWSQKKHTLKLGVNQIPDYFEFEPSESGGNGYRFYELAFVQNGYQKMQR